MNAIPHRFRTALLIIAAMAPVSLTADPSDNQNRDFPVSLNNCTEVIGFGTISAAQAQPFVPGPYVIAPIGPGLAGLVVRGANCQSMNVDGEEEGPSSIAQIGVAIIPPDGTGDVNNYTAVYVTSSERLAQRLRQAGMPATTDRGLLYEFTRGVQATSGELYVAAKPDEQPAFSIHGAVTDPPPGGFPFVANWWFKGSRGAVKMATTIAQLNYGAANIGVATGKFSVLGRMIGGNSFSNFSIFSARGAFGPAQMQTTVR